MLSALSCIAYLVVSICSHYDFSVSLQSGVEGSGLRFAVTATANIVALLGPPAAGTV